jgi:hypothetical protein
VGFDHSLEMFFFNKNKNKNKNKNGGFNERSNQSIIPKEI